MARHFEWLDSGHEFGGTVAASSFLEQGQRLTGVKVEIRGVVPDNPALVDERWENRKVFLFER
jgi:hypothetical protein